MVRERTFSIDASELPVGSRKVVTMGDRSFGVFNVGGNYVAVLNICPHQYGPVCLGRVGGTTLPSEPGKYVWGRDGEILACPWHGWEFDLVTGRAIADSRRHLHLLPVQVVDGRVYVTV